MKIEVSLSEAVKLNKELDKAIAKVGILLKAVKEMKKY